MNSHAHVILKSIGAMVALCLIPLMLQELGEGNNKSYHSSIWLQYYDVCTCTRLNWSANSFLNRSVTKQRAQNHKFERMILWEKSWFPRHLKSWAWQPRVTKLSASPGPCKNWKWLSPTYFLTVIHNNDEN